MLWRCGSKSALSIVAAAYGASSMGDQMTFLALILRFHDQGRSGVAISLLVIADVLPFVLVGPLAAPLVDRIESSRLIVSLTGLQAVVAGALIFMTDVVGTAVLLALLGAGLALVSPALQLLVPEIMGEKEITRGYARLETFRSAGNVAGPALAGLLIASFGDRMVLGCNVASYVLMSAAVLTLGVRRRPVAKMISTSWLTQVHQGIAVLTGDRILRTAILSLSSAIVFTAVLSVAQVFFIRDDLGASDVGYGVLTAAHAVGMMVTAALIAPRVPLAWQSRILVGAGALMGASLLVGALIPLFTVSLIAFFLTGTANSLQGLAVRNLIHARVPAHIRGRAFASSGAALNGANLVGTALGGPVTTALGGAGALQLAGAGTMLASLVALPVLARHQPIEQVEASAGQSIQEQVDE
ncbi:MFS transporter [Streptomyces sp. NPDC051132]|uniref:MFS transporter n=1 Tax=unclassified Streptomyces TaxID=2593676 RepID=UPI0034495626